MSKFWEEYPQLVNELEDVKAIMRKNIQYSEKFFEQPLHPMIDGGGKMLRPAFVLLAGKFGDYDNKKLHHLAAVIEMLHLATLIHDDIIDDSKLRRGCQTIQSQYGKDYAVYMGDFLFCRCFMMLSQYQYTPDNIKDIAKVISRICVGEIRQYHLRYARHISVIQYLRIISAKTAALFAFSFYIGAKEADCDDKLAKLLSRIGYNIGMGFQIIDDLLDYNGDTQLLGKSAQNDLKKGYYTLPLILALEKDKDNRLSNILKQSAYDDHDIKAIINLVRQYKGVEKTQNIADKYTKRTSIYIEYLPDCESKEILKEIVQKLLKRNY